MADQTPDILDATQSPVCTVKDFCLDVAIEHGQFLETEGNEYPTLDFQRDSLTPEEIADQFVRYFKLRYPLTVDQIRAVCNKSGFMLKAVRTPDKMRGANCSFNGQTYVYYKLDDPPTSQVHTLLHELYEIIDRELVEWAGARIRPRVMVDREANRFASNAQVPASLVRAWVKEHGIEVLALRRAFDCPYATALIQLKEGLRMAMLAEPDKYYPPMIGAIYERRFWKPTRSGRAPRLQLSFFVKTPGFPFRMQKPELRSLSIQHQQDIFQLHEMVMQERRGPLILENAELLYDGHALPIHVIIQPVHWPSVHRKAAKVIVQIFRPYPGGRI